MYIRKHLHNTGTTKPPSAALRMLAVITAAAMLMAGNCLAAEKPKGAHGPGSRLDSQVDSGHDSGPDSGEVKWYTHRSSRPEFPPAVAKLVADGIALINQAQWQAAIEKFDLALKDMPEGAAIYENRGVCYQKLGKFDLAIADFTKALELAPQMGPVVYANRGDCYKALGKPDLAVADYTRALALSPPDGEHLLLERGRLLVDLGDVKSAEQDFNQAKNFPSVRAPSYSELAYLALRKQDFRSCISLASKAIQADPKYPTAWVNRGACGIAQAKFEKAASDLSEAIRLRPDLAEAYLNRSVAYAAMGNCRGALDDANTVARLFPDRPDTARQLVARCR